MVGRYKIESWRKVLIKAVAKRHVALPCYASCAKNENAASNADGVDDFDEAALDVCHRPLQIVAALMPLALIPAGGAVSSRKTDNAASILPDR